MHGGLFDDVIAALTAAPLPVDEARKVVPRERGLYAVHGDGRAWSDLGLEAPRDGLPLYVGKAEKSLNSRDVGTHFATGKTGSSTIRRSLAALLADVLDLRATPRNPERPDGSANYALAHDGDERLTRWMTERLSLAVWVAPPDVELGEVETLALRRLEPPLNLAKVGAPRTKLKAARAAMAASARAQSPAG